MEHILETYCLRPVMEQDLELIRDWRNSDRLRAAMFSDDIITSEQQQMWFRKISMSAVDSYSLLEYQHRPVGLISFTQFEEKNNLAHWGFYVGEVAVPIGMGSILCYLGLDYAFERLRLRRVIGEVLESNARSQRLHERMGFIREGHYREHALKNGVYEDVIAYGLLADEWQAKRREISTRIFGRVLEKGVHSMLPGKLACRQLRNG